MSTFNFTLGSCDIGGHSYRFDYLSGKYAIFLTDNETEKQLHSFTEMKEAYDKWNEIKRPEKMKK